jgi:hypothetical protein
MLAVVGEKMGIASDILNLRDSQFSSVETLIAALERFHDASPENQFKREFLVHKAADIALTNIAAHAGEAIAALQATLARTQRAIPIRRRSRRSTSGPTLQRPLFAAVGRFVS